MTMTQSQIEAAVAGVMELRPGKKVEAVPQPIKSKSEMVKFRKRKSDIDFKLELEKIERGDL